MLVYNIKNIHYAEKVMKDEYSSQKPVSFPQEVHEIINYLHGADFQYAIFADFDLVYSKHATENILQHAIKVQFGKVEVLTLCPEAMLLLKINQITMPGRTGEKMRRDKIVINLLREKVDMGKLI